MKTNIIQEIIYKIKSMLKKRTSNSYTFSNDSKTGYDMKKYVIGLIVIILGFLILTNVETTGLFAASTLENELDDTKESLSTVQLNLTTSQQELQTCTTSLNSCNTETDSLSDLIKNESFCEDQKDDLKKCKDDLKDEKSLSNDYEDIIEDNGDLICCDGEPSGTEKSWELDDGDFECGDKDEYSNDVTCSA